MISLDLYYLQKKTTKQSWYNKDSTFKNCPATLKTPNALYEGAINQNDKLFESKIVLQI